MITIPNLHVTFRIAHAEPNVCAVAPVKFENGSIHVKNSTSFITCVEEFHACVAYGVRRIIRLCPNAVHVAADMKYMWLFALDVSNGFDDYSKPLLIPCGLVGGMDSESTHRSLISPIGIAYTGQHRNRISATYFTDPNLLVRGLCASWTHDFQRPRVEQVTKVRHEANGCRILDCDRALFSA